MFCVIYPGVMNFPGNFLYAATSDADGDMDLKAVNLVSFMTFGTASLVTAFHKKSK